MSNSITKSNQKCFVVMPFGQKPKLNGNGDMFDFDKVYRVLIKRAITEAGLEPIRADETGGNRLIHADMFKDLRDRPVVLVDLSMYNPNVYYELGVRHVMSPCGTVLICSKEFERLPFDVALSRVIFYDYDGKNLDWEVVEDAVKEIQAALEEAKNGEPDSPVYAFLENVISPHAQPKEENDSSYGEPNNEHIYLNVYQQTIAEHWAETDEPIDKLLKEHGESVFGMRAVGHFTLKKKHPYDLASQVARSLYWHEQYDIANQIFKTLKDSGEMTIHDMMIYGSSISEEQPILQTAKEGLKIVRQAHELVKVRLEKDEEDEIALQDMAYVTHGMAGLFTWKWNLTRNSDDLEIAIEILQRAGDYMERVIAKQVNYPLGRYALNRFKLALFLRIKDQDPMRIDKEGLLQTILSLKPHPNEHPASASYLRWYQVISMADIGNGNAAAERARKATVEDIRIRNMPDCDDIGKRQYAVLRRFLEHYSSYWQHPTELARISQILQAAS